jgi:ubiquitin-protein ligase
VPRARARDMADPAAPGPQGSDGAAAVAAGLAPAAAGDEPPGRGAAPDWAWLPIELLLAVLAAADAAAAPRGCLPHFVARSVCRRWRAACAPAQVLRHLLRASPRLLPRLWAAADAAPTVPRPALLTHLLLLRQARAGATLLRARNAALRQRAGRPERSELGGAEQRLLEEPADACDGGEPVLLRLRYDAARRGYVAVDVALLAPRGSPAAGALLRLRLDVPDNYPFAGPRAALRAPAARDDADAQPPPLPLRHGDVDAASGDVREGMVPRDAWSAVWTLRTLAEHVRAALGAPPACPDAVEAAALADEAPGAARELAQRTGCLPLADALRDAAALLGDDAAAAPRDWPRLEQMVALHAPAPAHMRAAAVAAAAATRGRPAALRAALWARSEAPARAALLRLLRWSRLLCCVAAGRPAALRAPSPLERAIDAELHIAPEIAEHGGAAPAAAAPPRSFLPDPEAERAAWERHVAAHGAAAARHAWYDLHRAGSDDVDEDDAPPPRAAVDAAAAGDEAALDAAEAAWAAAAGLSPPDAAAGRAAAAGCHRLPPLARAWCPLGAELGGGLGGAFAAKLAGMLRAHALPMRRLVLREIADMAAALPAPHGLVGFDLQLALLLARATSGDVAEALLQAAAAHEGGPRSLAQYAGLLGDEA